MADEKMLGQYDYAAINCPDCSKTVEILNNDVEFSLQLHGQSHKPLEEITQDMEHVLITSYFNMSSKCDENLSDVCAVCNERVIILNNDIHLSLQLHAQNHKTQDVQNNVNRSEDQSFEKELDLSLVSKVKELTLNHIPGLSDSNNAKPYEDFIKPEKNLDKEFLRYISEHFDNGKYMHDNGKGEISCLLCRCDVPPTMKNVKEHLSGKFHRYNEEGLKPVGFELSADTSQVLKAHSVLDKTTNSNELLFEFKQQFNDMECDYLSQTKENNVLCLLCNCLLLSTKAIKEHLLNKPHHNKKNIKSNLKDKGIIEINGIELFCVFCKCKITSGHKNVKQHLGGSLHKYRENISNTVANRSMAHQISTSSVFEVSQNITKNPEGRLECSICDCKLSGDKVLEQHVKGRNHKARAKMTEKLPSLSQLSTVGSKSFIIKNNELTRILNNISKQCINAKCHYIVESGNQYVVKCSICQCQIPKAKKNIREHLTGLKHKKIEKYQLE